ncbi:hypothetical protein BCR41DRAFT_389235 [Lobosporangium transversale]|uniref:Periplasmic binding protein n=1 Tax=Lobosporangium transversale TaxID=64571 RepID=A0A1Y2GDA0_9FUNG|nr:hypothetical protein BCR41DRAFT_389235 [Lobosporangium transversale]ORZ06307.1 hypothetical protein BCR41DRAFT_389235 [Lobosporangium transversale]|eukprot:XP_021877470.1 hypothetical protein BCR41DRAFT_389235 [Lobosporangium transversale]
MFHSIAVLTTTVALTLLTTVHAQVYCGGQISEIANGTLGGFKAQYLSNITLVTLFGQNNNKDFEQYVLYCGDQAPDTLALQAHGIPTSVGIFKVPLQSVGVEGTFTSSYVEVAGSGSAIKVLEDPQNVVSPCLQQAVSNGTITALNDGDFSQYESLNATFRENMHPGQKKDIWVPTTRTEADPLLRVEYIIAISLFFNNGQHGETIYNNIRNAYTTLKNDMARIPLANRKRIAWVRYDFSTSTWRLRNSAFVKKIIEAAGGVSFPLHADGLDDASVSADDIKTLLVNAQIIIDETDFTNRMTYNGKVYSSAVELWRTLAGFLVSDMLPALSKNKVYSLDKTANAKGISDFEYRLASRPDILLKDLISVQYPYYEPGYNTTFLNDDFSTTGGPATRLGASDCGIVPYNTGDIPQVQPNPYFKGDEDVPPPLIGNGIYGAGGEQDNNGNGNGSGKKTGIIVAVVCVAVVLGAAFAFAFFKWGKRSKEDRFIELEEEMNNEIPLH